MRLCSFSCATIVAAGFLFMFSIASNALPSAGDHAELWLYSIGATDYHPLKRAFTELSSTIDKGLSHDTLKAAMQKKIPGILQKLPDDFKFGIEAGLHRRVFHWGLRCDPRNLRNESTTAPLIKLLDLRIAKAEILTETEKNELRKEFYIAIGEEWKNRQDNFSNEVQCIFGNEIRSTAGGIPPIAFVLYQIHIIADFMDTSTDALGSFDEHFNKELIEKGLEAIPQTDKLIRALNHAYNRQPPISAGELEKMIKKRPERLSVLFYRSTGSVEDETRRRALHLLLILQDQLPDVLLRAYPESMKRLDITASGGDSSPSWWRFW